MAESTQPENKTKKVNLSDILDSKRNTQMLPDELNDIQFRPLAMKAEKHQAKIDKLNIRAAKLTDKINNQYYIYRYIHFDHLFHILISFLLFQSIFNQQSSFHFFQQHNSIYLLYIVTSNISK